MATWPSRPLSGAHPPTWKDFGLHSCFAYGRRTLSRMNEPEVDPRNHLFTNALGLTECHSNLSPFSSILSLAHVHAALAYYHANQEDIEADMAAEDTQAKALEQEHARHRGAGA